MPLPAPQAPAPPPMPRPEETPSAWPPEWAPEWTEEQTAEAQRWLAENAAAFEAWDQHTERLGVPLAAFRIS